MEVKTGIEEKRVKSTIIRRRARVEPTPPVPPPPEWVQRVAGGETEVPSSQAPADTILRTVPTTEPPQKREILPTAAETEEKVRPVKRVVKKKSKDELELEMIERAGGLKKAAEMIESSPERLERVFRPDRSSRKKRVITRRDFRKTEITTPSAAKRVVRIEGNVSVADLAKRMSIKGGEVLKKLINLGVMVTINQTIDSDTAVLVAHDFGYEVENVTFAEKSIIERGETKEEEGETKLPRPPIVTVMGHVDHGKTSLLDAIRKTQVAAGEAGGITQHIGAYEVLLPKGRVTFVDTPGHEAFTAMRARGAQVTDIVILVVAADDGVMPQTIEAIQHAKAAKVPIIVAINKIDKPEADPARVERGLMEQGLVSEKLGGETIIMPISAKTGQGINEILEMILLQAEVLELKANPKKRASGTIIEARLDRGRGPVATVIIQEGTLRIGEIIVAGTVPGKVRALIDAEGRSVLEAPPSKPVEVLGLSGIPLAGDKLHVMESEEDARLVSEHRGEKLRELRYRLQAPAARLEDLYTQAAQGEVPELRVLIKGDMQGSIEALRESLGKLSGARVRVTVLHGGVGAITESDVMLAVASRAIVIGFNMRPDVKARQLAEQEKVQIRSYSIIYDVIDDVKKAMEGMLKPTYEEKYLGRAEVRQLFAVSKIGTVAGSAVIDGKILRTASVRVIRDGKNVFDGKLSSLKRFKEDAREVTSGLECGIGVENFNDLKISDIVEAYQVEEIAGKL